MQPTATVEIVSFGYLHGEPPAAHLTIDLREHFRDPHVRPDLRFMTADDDPVRRAVLGTPGLINLITSTTLAVRAFASGPSAGVIRIAGGCAGGRHRAPTFARVLAELLDDAEFTVTVSHRDLDKPVVQR
ncbi:RNase adapter RapZ [Streptomyces sp. SCSIO ZS0520]|uniref:RapZ C-terminal domain-containing protein n=1 Tax=Streptomyces sp. SCSIO ZS0520 TaxID=2892996 RepID=UPI0021DAB879|nr:RNase adapter RapZ [Streptomyces sp. SCSIO ZS0520]